MEKFVKTCRPILTYTVDLDDVEGSKGTGIGGGLIWLMITTAILVFSILIFGGFIPLPVLIVVNIIIGVITFLHIPFKLKEKMKNFYNLLESTGNDISTINDILDITDDNLIIWNNDMVGYMLICKPNHYVNYTNYANDFSNFIELFSDFNITITGLKNTKPVDYIQTNKLGIYKDKDVLLDRLRLAVYASDKFSKISNAYSVIITISTNQINLRKLNNQMEEMKYSEFKRTFRSIIVANADVAFKVMGRDLGINLSRDYLLLNKTKKVLDIEKDENVKIER